MARARERILTIGPPGVGKSYQWLLIARWLKDTGARFFVIDTDNALDRMLEGEFSDVAEMIVPYMVYDWKEHTAARDDIIARVQPDDWVVIDMADKPWDTVQNYFVDDVFGEDIGQFFLAARKSMNSNAQGVAAFDGWKDWQVINRLYNSFIMPLVFKKNQGHLYMTCKGKSVGKMDDQETKDTYGPFKLQPSGQKDLGHQVHTIFIQQMGQKFGTWEVTTVKDRGGRRYFDHKPLSVGLAKQYLQAVAGWEI